MIRFWTVLFCIILTGKAHAFPAGYRAYFTFEGAAVEHVSGDVGAVYGATLTADRFGNLNSAYMLDGVDDYIQFAHRDSYNFDPTSDFTIGVWVKVDPIQPDTEFATNDIIAKWTGHSSGSGEGYPYTIRYLNQTNTDPGKVVGIRFDPVTRENPSVESQSRLDDGEFHNIVFAKEGSMMRLYVDGVMERENPDTTTLATNNLADLYFGRRGQDAPFDSFFKGVIDDAYIWDRALTDAEVNDLVAPTPIPGAVWLLGSGLAGLIALRRKLS